MAFWLHTGVDVRDGFSRSCVSCLVHMLRNCNDTLVRWSISCDITSSIKVTTTGFNYLPEMERRARF